MANRKIERRFISVEKNFSIIPPKTYTQQIIEQVAEQQKKQQEETKQKGETREKKYHFTTNWFEPNIPKWEKTLTHLKDQKINVLEIGVFEGRSTTWILEKLLKNPESKLVAVDLFEKFWYNYDHEKTFRENIQKSGRESQVEIIKSNSFDVLARLNHEKEKQFDFIYIDGSHAAQDVLADATLSWNLLKERGILIFDDYEWDYFEEEYNNPRIAIDAFLRCYQTQIEIIYKHYQVVVKKVSREALRTEREDKKIYC